MDAGGRAVYPSEMRVSLASLAVTLVIGASGCGEGSAVTTSNTTGTGGDGATTGGSGGGGTGGAGGATGGAGGTGGAAPAACEGKTGETGDSNLELMFGGLLRDADIHVPAGYDPSAATALVLNFHGFLSYAGQEAEISEMSAASDERGFIVVYPSGTSSSWNTGPLCCGTAASLGVDDVGFVAALIDELAKRYCIDPKRVFATGMSNGGFLSNRLGCELSDRIAAIAPVSGVFGFPVEECAPGRKVPVIHFHGTGDLVVPYDGNAFLGYIPAQESVGRWREIDGCGVTGEVVYNVGDSECVSANGCADGSDVVLCTIDGGGHQWPGGQPLPGGGVVTMDLDATNVMLDFFEEHPMP